MKYYGLIDYNLLFSTNREYKVKRKIIRENYERMNVQEKVIYRMYVYSRPLLTEKQKDFIWEELNNPYWEETQDGNN